MVVFMQLQYLLNFIDKRDKDIVYLKCHIDFWQIYCKKSIVLIDTSKIPLEGHLMAFAKLKEKCHFELVN